MRKIALLIAVLFMAVPVMGASNVVITCAQVPDTNKVTVSYASDANLIRAFGLDITVTTADANITKVDVCDVNYRIFPGQIEIDDGEVTDYSTPYASDDLGDANLAIEMGSLYTEDDNYAGDPNAGYNMKPGLAGTLLAFYVDGECNVCVTENVLTGGVVMEDPYEDPNVTTCCVQVQLECYAGQPDYDQWVAVEKPECWCWPRQCLGDADGEADGKDNYWVSNPDLSILKSYWQIKNGPVGMPGACADFDHSGDGKDNYRVSNPDLAILKSNWQIKNGPDPNCLPGNREPE